MIFPTFEEFEADLRARRPEWFGGIAAKRTRIDSVALEPLDVERVEKVTPEAGKPQSVTICPVPDPPPQLDWQSRAAGERDEGWDGVEDEPQEESNHGG